MENWLATLEAISSDPVAMVALVLAAAMCLDLMFVRVSWPTGELRLTAEERRAEKEARKTRSETAHALRGVDLRVVAQAVEDIIIDRQHLTRILGTRALDLWIDLALEERDGGPTVKTRAKIVAFEPVALDEARVAQSARMIKRRVAEELGEVLGLDDTDALVNGGVTIETAIERTA